MSIEFTISDIQRILEEYDEGIFEAAHLICVKSEPIESLKRLYDQAKHTLVEARLLLNNLEVGTEPEKTDFVDMITLELADKCLPPLIRKAEAACKKISDEYPEFVLR